MKVYKICIEDFSRCKTSEYIYKDLDKAKAFTIDKLNETMKNVLDDNENTKNFEDRIYIFETYDKKEMERFSITYNEYYKSVKKIDDYIIELVDNFLDKLRYTYQVKYSIITEDEKYTDYNYSIYIEEFDLIE